MPYLMTSEKMINVKVQASVPIIASKIPCPRNRLWPVLAADSYASKLSCKNSARFTATAYCNSIVSKIAKVARACSANLSIS